MNRITRTAIVSIILISALTKGCNILSEKQNSIPLAHPAFVLDSIKVSAFLRTDSLTHSPFLYIPFTTIWHFEGTSGSIPIFGVLVGNKEIGYILDRLYPVGIQDSITSFYDTRYRGDYRTNDRLFAGVDSVSIHFEIAGLFGRRIDTTNRYTYDFSVNRNITVFIQR